MSADEDADVRSCVDVLDRYVAELRRYMQRFPWPAGGDASGADSADPVPEEAQEDEWAQLPTEVTWQRGSWLCYDCPFCHSLRVCCRKWSVSPS